MSPTIGRRDSPMTFLHKIQSSQQCNVEAKSQSVGITDLDHVTMRRSSLEVLVKTLHIRQKRVNFVSCRSKAHDSGGVVIFLTQDKVFSAWATFEPIVVCLPQLGMPCIKLRTISRLGDLHLKGDARRSAHLIVALATSIANSVSVSTKSSQSCDGEGIHPFSTCEQHSSETQLRNADPRIDC